MTILDDQSSETISLRWFNTYPNQKKMLEKKDHLTFMGEITHYKGSKQIVNPNISDLPQKYDQIIIEYPTVNKVSGKFINKYIDLIPDSIWDKIQETLPKFLLQQKQTKRLKLVNMFVRIITRSNHGMITIR